ncbi:hypothetical protein [Aliarcobacter butzleri]|uniref:Uncharacterized protein n=1 Tax=Aliarcobacter butzleri L351 TaxID=1447259 RepID=A0A837J6V0_9BACT|nr:hypothetical protein [Aliarcobacter butzleri]KLE01928.1 hypothetical protein AF76_03730 [Aliarcobacter butzleri L351]KLE12368.1 hypothetical protein AF75_09110 [Aliarcobacter butzleri L350]MDN5105768.1 hypothetical protein [Aliarcobacter butzleri]
MKMYYISNLLKRFDTLRINPVENHNKLEELLLEVRAIISGKEKSKDKYFIEILEFISDEVYCTINKADEVEL